MEYDLRTVAWRPQFMRTATITSDGYRVSVDIYMFAAPEGRRANGAPIPAITVSVPSGRVDLVEFIHRSLLAGQNEFCQLRPGEEFAPESRCPFPERAH